MNIFAFSGILVAFTCIPLFVILYKYGYTKLHRVWGFFNLTVTLWGVGNFFAAIAKTQELASLGWKLAYIGAIFIPSVFFHSITIYHNLNRRTFKFFAYAQSIFYSFFVIFSDLYITRDWLLFRGIYYFKNSTFLPSSLTLWLIINSYALFLLVKHSCKLDKTEKRRSRYLFYGTLIGFSGGVFSIMPSFGVPLYPYASLLVPLYFIIINFAIFRHQLLEITVVMSRGLVYSILVAILTIIYFILVLLLERIFQDILLYDPRIGSVICALIIASFFAPLRNKIQSIVDKKLFKATTSELAEQVEHYREEATQSEKLKAIATLASGMAHEVKNPLTAIKTFAEYLPEKWEDPEFRQKFNKIVGSEVDRIDNIVHQLLDFAKPSPLERKKVDICRLITDTLSFLNSKFIKSNISIKTDFNPDFINADPIRLKQAFLNLFLNSIDALPDGGILEVSAVPVDNSIQIIIKDSGAGINKEDLPHIFDPFFSKKDNGTGLGLSITQQIIKEHGGKIEVESKEGVGTTFVIGLPTKNSKP